MAEASVIQYWHPRNDARLRKEACTALDDGCDSITRMLERQWTMTECPSSSLRLHSSHNNTMTWAEQPQAAIATHSWIGLGSSTNTTNYLFLRILHEHPEETALEHQLGVDPSVGLHCGRVNGGGGGGEGRRGGREENAYVRVCIVVK